jgi:hypothetical protein
MDYRDFTKLEVGSAFEVDVTRGDSYFVSITADDNLFQHLDIRQVGKTLYIGLKQPRIYLRTTQKAAIVMPELERLDLSGASKGEIHGFSTENRVEFNISGASSLELDDIEADDIEFDISGASKAIGSILADDCNFDVSGASSVELTGSAAEVSIEASGASRARLADFAVINADVELSGASSATINASGDLTVDLSGASQLEYIGNPSLETIEVSGGSSIRRR